MVEWIIEPLSYAFIMRGLAAAILTGIACAVLSAFVVWRGMSFVGDAMAHAILPGIVLAYITGTSLFFGALGMAVIVAAGIGWLSRRGEIKEDTAIGVIFTGFFALGILMLSRVTSYQDLTHILFGDILGVSTGDLTIMLVIMVIVLAVIFVFYKELLVTSFDPSHSIAIGLSPELVRYGLLMLIALTVVSAIQVVGVVLVLALLITPAAAASQLARRLPAIIGLSVLFAVISAIVGFYASYYANVASGSAVVLTLTVIFGISFGVNTLKNRIK
ncbi:MAG: metal ABC transporter permease [Anaerolineales bacterium]|nr:metal ABC transporter permease [Anaerolineales bacterium]